LLPMKPAMRPRTIQLMTCIEFFLPTGVFHVPFRGGAVAAAARSPGV
jgi:hypothetical protein